MEIVFGGCLSAISEVIPSNILGFQTKLSIWSRKMFSLKTEIDRRWTKIGQIIMQTTREIVKIIVISTSRITEIPKIQLEVWRIESRRIKIRIKADLCSLFLWIFIRFFSNVLCSHFINYSWLVACYAL